MSEHDETIYRTSTGRVGKMMAILCGTVIVGAIIFFALGDYWISEPVSYTHLTLPTTPYV